MGPVQGQQAEGPRDLSTRTQNGCEYLFIRLFAMSIRARLGMFSVALPAKTIVVLWAEGKIPATAGYNDCRFIAKNIFLNIRPLTQLSIAFGPACVSDKNIVFISKALTVVVVTFADFFRCCCHF